MLADTGRTRRHQVHWLDAGNDELLEQLRVLNGYDTELAADATRLTNRLRDALTGLSPALERVLGPRLHNAGARDLLARYPTPQALATAGRGRIARTLRKRSPRLAKALTEATASSTTRACARQPGYMGARGYHPLLAVAAGTGEVLMARLREGRAHNGRGAAHFLRETVGRVRAAGAAGS